MMVGKSKFVYDAEDAAGLIVTSPAPELPRSLASGSNLAYRRSLLDRAHMRPLNKLVAKLRNENRGFVPDFDPLDGGTSARLLFLLEKPGPMTDPHRKGKPGSGFVSRDNDDATATAIFTFMEVADIPRDECVIWNTIPWWNETTKISATEWTDGLARLGDTMDLLTRLEGVILIGKKAARAKPFIEAKGLPVWVSAHPSPRVRSAYPDLFWSIPSIWREAATHLGTNIR